MSLAAQDPDAVSVLHMNPFTRIDRSGFDRDPVSLPADHAHRVEVAFRGKICSEYQRPVLHFDPGDVVVPRCHTEVLLERGAELRHVDRGLRWRLGLDLLGRRRRWALRFGCGLRTQVDGAGEDVEDVSGVTAVA